jgi:hypothetical protein
MIAATGLFVDETECSVFFIETKSGDAALIIAVFIDSVYIFFIGRNREVGRIARRMFAYKTEIAGLTIEFVNIDALTFTGGIRAD